MAVVRRLHLCHAIMLAAAAGVLGSLACPSPAWAEDDLAYHVYLLEGARERGATYVAGRDVRSHIDRARAFTVLDASSNMRAGCLLDALVAREIARAVL